MKPFNLEEYLKNPSKKVVTRDGRSVKRVLCTDAMGSYPIVVLIENCDGTSDDAIKYTKDGRYFTKGTDDKDLFFATEKHEGWVNIYKAGVQRETLGYLQTRYAGSSIWPTEEAAKTAADPDPVATIKIEWEEQVWTLVEHANTGRDG